MANTNPNLRLVQPVRTVPRLNGKAILAAVIPSLGTIFAVLVQFAATGELNRPELITAVTGGGAAALALLGAWAGSTGAVVADTSQTAPVPPDVRAKLPAGA